MEIPRTLEQRLKSGRLIPFVGAGVSMSVRHRELKSPLFPNWKQLLERAAERLQAERKENYSQLVRALLEIDKPDFMEAARRAAEGLGAVWFEFLTEQFDHDRGSADDDSLVLAKEVWGLGSNLIITTNFDKVLSWACPRPADLRTWNIEATAEQITAQREGVTRPTVWHLHGYIDDAASLILTTEDYERLYPASGGAMASYAAALDTLRSSLKTHSFLFVGFSLSDEQFGLQLRSISNIYKGTAGPHYVIVRESERERLLSLDMPGVEVVTFPDFGKPQIDLLRAIGDLAGSEKRGAVPDAVTESGAGAASAASAYSPHNYVFSVPFRAKEEQVVGREGAIQAVRKQLAEGRRTHIGQTAIFQGLGGLGKTQLAVEYAYRHKDSYPNGVIWLNADLDIDAQLIEVADKAKWIHPNSEHKDKLEVALNRLRTYSDCLIIFDNLNNQESIENYLPLPQANPHILVTSRFEQADFWSVPLDLLSSADSLNLLTQEAGRKPEGVPEAQAAGEIAEVLGGLPLALELAGAYLRRRALVTWRDYRDLLNTNLRSALPGRLGSFTKHEADLYSTLKISEEVFSEEPALRNILDLLAWSGSAPMGIPLMCALLDTPFLEIAGALGLGESLRILKKTTDGNSIVLHRLVGEVRREEVPLETRGEWVDRVSQRIGDWFYDLIGEVTEIPKIEAEIDHLRAWQNNCTTLAPAHLPRLIWLQTGIPNYRGQYRESQKLLNKALQIYEAQNRDDVELKAYILHDLGDAEESLGNYSLALEYAQKALEVRRESYGEEHEVVSESLHLVGEILREKFDNRRAQTYLEKALAISEATNGRKSKESAYILGDLALIYARLGYKEKALSAVSEFQEIMRELYGENPHYAGWAFHNAAVVMAKLNRPKQAISNQEKALALLREVYGENHPGTAAMLMSLGSNYVGLDNAKALGYLDRALKIEIEVLGEKHPNTARIIYEKARAMWKSGRYQDALLAMERALTLEEEVLEPNSPITVISKIGYATMLNGSGQRERAFDIIEALYRELRGIL